MRLLARREHSCLELQQKLARRFGREAAPLIAAEVAQLKDQGLQSDSRLAEAYVAARSSKGQGPLKIRAELRAKGLADSLIDAALAASPVDWQRLAREVAAKKRRQTPDAATPKGRARLHRFMQQRGFAGGQYNGGHGQQRPQALLP